MSTVASEAKSGAVGRLVGTLVIFAEMSLFNDSMIVHLWNVAGATDSIAFASDSKNDKVF